MRLSFKLVIIICFVFLFSNCKNGKKEEPKNWIELYNGKDLTGWIVKINGYELNNNYKNTFRSENGVIKVSYDQYDDFSNQFGHLFYKTPFSNYKLKLQYRFIGEQAPGGASWAKKNSGIMIHSQSPESMLVDQGFPLSLEVQFLGGVTKDEARPTGNLCTPATHVEMDGKLITEHCITANCKTYYGDEWIHVEISVNKDSITHIIDGKPVISYSKPTIGGEFLESTSTDIQAKDGQALTSGYISLQSESHPIEFRNIKILEL